MTETERKELVVALKTLGVDHASVPIVLDFVEDIRVELDTLRANLDSSMKDLDAARKLAEEATNTVLEIHERILPFLTKAHLAAGPTVAASVGIALERREILGRNRLLLALLKKFESNPGISVTIRNVARELS